MTHATLRIAVLIPCYNEEQAIAAVVRDFKAALPSAQVYVYDNNSTDATQARAREAGAVVRTEVRQGKGCVVGSRLGRVRRVVVVNVNLRGR